MGILVAAVFTQGGYALADTSDRKTILNQVLKEKIFIL